MNRLILDYFRRWWWMFALGGALQFCIGGSIVGRPDYPFEFWIFMVSTWMGAMLLNLDLKRGAARAVMSLPLTARQIGRAWWLATIIVPAIWLGALLFLGAGTAHYFHPDKIIPTRLLALASLFVLPWLGTAFTAFYGMSNDAIFGTWRERFNSTFFSLLSVAMLFGGMLTLQNSTKQPVKFSIYLAVGLFLIAAGWVRAEKFVRNRATFRLPTVKYRNPLGQCRAPAGYGGIPFLISTSFVRIFLYVAAMVGLMALLMFSRGGNLPDNLKVAMFAGMSSLMSCGFIIVFQVLPVLRQLRLLRTLPISTARLSFVTIAIAILPLMLLGGLATGIAWLTLGDQAAGTFLSNYIFVLAPLSLCVFFAAWLGDRVAGYVLLAVTLFGMQQVQLRLPMFYHLREMPVGWALGIALAGVVLALVFTRLALARSPGSRRAMPGSAA